MRGVVRSGAGAGGKRRQGLAGTRCLIFSKRWLEQRTLAGYARRLHAVEATCTGRPGCATTDPTGCRTNLDRIYAAGATVDRARASAGRRGACAVVGTHTLPTAAEAGLPEPARNRQVRSARKAAEEAGWKQNTCGTSLRKQCCRGCSIEEVGEHESFAANDFIRLQAEWGREHGSRIDAGVELAALAAGVGFGGKIPQESGVEFASGKRGRQLLVSTQDTFARRPPAIISAPVRRSESPTAETTAQGRWA